MKTPFNACILGLVLTCALLSAPLQILILTGVTDLPYHDWRESTPVIRKALEATGRFEVKVLEDPRGLNARMLAAYDAVLLHYNGPRWGDEAEKALEDYVRAGKGMISLHGVTYGPFFNTGPKTRLTGEPAWPGFPALIGSTWTAVGHAPRHVFDVEWVDREHPVARGLPARFTANDELYHSIQTNPNAQVLARAFDDPANKGTGKMEPIVWAVPYGKGRTLHISLGHDLAAMYQPGFFTAVTRATEWVATGQVTLPLSGTAAKPAVKALLVTGAHRYPAGLFAALEGYDDITWEHAGSSAVFTPGMKDRYNVVVIGEIPANITATEKTALRDFIEGGGGVVALHHAISDEASWKWWNEEVVGARYSAGKTASQQQETEMIARATKAGAAHPVLRKVAPLIIKDEAYRGVWLKPGVAVLMETGAAASDTAAVVVGPHQKARVVYIQPGQNDSTVRNPAYRKLLRQAILWAARNLE